MPPVTPATAPAAAPTPIPQVTPQSVTAPTPQYNPAASMDAIKQYYRIPSSTALAVANAKSNATISGQQFENQRAQQQLQVQNLQDRLDPGKYQIHNDKDGTHIIDPLGKEVDIGTYTNLTGENPAKVLANSTNPDDQRFVQDYNNYEQLMQALVTKDSNKESAAVYNDFLQANPGLATLTPDQVRQAFLGKYSTYFGVPKGDSSYTGGFNPAYDPAAARYAYQRSPGGPLQMSALGTTTAPSAPPNLSSLAPTAGQ